MTQIICPHCREDLTEAVAIWGDRALSTHPCPAEDPQVAQARALERIADALERLVERRPAGCKHSAQDWYHDTSNALRCHACEGD